MARRQVSIFINGKEVANQLNSITAEKRKIVAELNRMTIGTEEYEKAVGELKKADNVLNEHRDKLRNTSGQYDLLRGGLTRFAGVAAAAFAVENIVAFGKDLFKLGLELDNTERKARIVFGSALPLVTEAAKKNATEIGLTTDGYTKLAAEIGDLLVPMGFQRDEAAKMSTTMVGLAGALTEWSGGQYTAEETTVSLQKALMGEREEMERYGISLKQSELNARLAEKGLDKLTGSLRQQAEATVTLEAIMQKSSDAQRAYAENSDSNARRQAQLSAQFKQLKEDLAVALIPVFERLMSVAEFFTDALSGISQGLSGMSTGAGKAVTSVQKLNAQFNTEIETLARGNLSQENRAKLIEHINTKYKDYLPNLITETTSLDELRTAQLKANEAFKERITLLATQEAFQKVQTALVNEKARELELQVELTRAQENFNKAAEAGRQLIQGDDRAQRQAVNQLEGLRSAEQAVKDNILAQKQLEDQFARIQKAAKEANISLDVTGKDSPTTPGFTDNSAANKAAEKAEKELEKQLERLQEIRASFEEKARLAALDEDERKLEELRLKYDKEIAIAKELEAKGVTEATAQRIALERLKEEELNKLRDELSEAAVSRIVEEQTKLTETEMEQRLLHEEKKKELEATLKEEADAVLLTERELAIQELELFYTTMLDMASAYGEGREQVDMIYRAKLLEINKEFDKKDKESLAKAQDEKLKALQAAFSGISDLFGSLYDFLADEESEFAGFQKVITFTQIALDTASAISSLVAASEANAANGGTFGLAGIAQFAAGFARIVTNMAKAKQLLSTEVPQKVTGGYVTVTGADDGRSYNARRVGAPATGMLPPGPALVDTVAGPVLANEVGQEYFVSTDALRNPMVFDMVRAIDNISRTRQFQNGGFTAPPAPEGGAAVATPPSGAGGLDVLLRRLLTVLENPLYARIDDDTIIDVRDRLNVLERGAGN